MLGNEIASGNLLNDYSYITADTTAGSVIARCVTGLGPNDVDDNNALGGFYLGGNRIPNGECASSTRAIQPNGAPINEYVGVINLYQCGPLSSTQEGVYTCTMMSSSMMNESMRLGVFLNGRSKSLIILFIHNLIHTYVCIYAYACIHTVCTYILYICMYVQCMYICDWI